MLFALLLPAATAGAQGLYSVLHTFSGVEAPGAAGTLIEAADGNFYGVSSASTYPDPSAIIRLTPTGRMSILHTLTAAEGTSIAAFLQGSDGKFYGATSDGGASGVGTIFNVTLTGTFTVLHSFSGRRAGTPGDSDGATPRALIQGADGNFYGLTLAGGDAAGGTFFRMTPAGTVSVLYSFFGSFGFEFPSTLMQASDGNFYGGGYTGLFKLTPSGSLTILATGSGSPSDYSPSTLIEGPDGNLYGTTPGGCVLAKPPFCAGGLAFKMTKAGQRTVLHTFGTGEHPHGLVLRDGQFYGTTDTSIYKMTLDGAVTVVHDFAAERPYRGPSLAAASDGSLYGTVTTALYYGGYVKGTSGTLFRLAPDNTWSRTAIVFEGGIADGALPAAALLEAVDGNFYGTTPFGGTFGLGTIFRLTRNGALSILHNFAGGNDGASPYAPLIQLNDGSFYGTTSLGGGSANAGTVFRMSPTGGLSIVHRFAGGGEGRNPFAPLMQAADGYLYGTSATTIFRMAPGGTPVTVHALDPNIEGAETSAGLVQGRDGSFYGVTSTVNASSDANYYGTIFRMTPAGQVTVLYAFRLGADGGFPQAGLVQGADGNFYGTTTLGGTGYGGTVFKITPQGQFTLLRGLSTLTDGAGPAAPLLRAPDGNLYGVTQRGGYPGTVTKGTVFRISPSGVFALVHTFDTTSGAAPVAALIQAKDGALYGTARNGGTANAGVVFRLVPPAAMPAMLIDRTSLRFGAVGTGSGFFVSTPSQTVRLQQGQGTPVQWTAASNRPWLTVTPASGAGPAALSVAVKFDGTLPPSGSVTGAVTFTLSGASTTVGPLDVTLTIEPATAVSAPFGSFDTPAGDAAVLAGSIAVTGWTLDNVGVRRVELWRDLVAGETTPPFTSTPTDPRHGKVFISDVTFVDGARPDVEALYPATPSAYRAGWGYLLLTWGLPNQGNGTYQLYAYAFDEENNVATLGTKAILAANNSATKPFGTIDTPAIGGDTSGPNFGWALTPKVNGAATCRIPSSGVQVSIDSSPFQPVVYGDARSDVAAAFAGFSNSAAAGGHYVVDWTTLTNGTHTIGWLVTDDCGRADGIGSRFFTVANSTNPLTLESPPAVGAPAMRVGETESDAPITVARGVGELPVILTPGEAGSRSVEVKQGERIEMRLPHGFESAYQLAKDGERRALPIGSSWDAASGTFYWQPAAGFLGRYRLVFSNGSERINVRVVVTP